MRRRTRVVTASLWILPVFFCCPQRNVKGQLQPDKNTGVIAEKTLRSHAITAELPIYPEDAVRARKSGVAVAVVEVDTVGRVSHVSILEAPSASIAASVKETVARWRFQPFVRGVTDQATAMRGKVVFYFVIAGGKGTVYTSTHAPYIGRWPEERPTE